MKATVSVRRPGGSRAAAGCSDRHFDFLGQVTGNLPEYHGQAQMRHRAGGVDGDPLQRPGDRQVRQQVTTPGDGIDDREVFVIGPLVGVELRRDIFRQTQRAGGGIDNDGQCAAVAPAPQGVCDGLGHELVALPIRFRFPGVEQQYPPTSEGIHIGLPARLDSASRASGSEGAGGRLGSRPKIRLTQAEK
jgi:hypothetical protein